MTDLDSLVLSGDGLGLRNSEYDREDALKAYRAIEDVIASARQAGLNNIASYARGIRAALKLEMRKAND